MKIQMDVAEGKAITEDGIFYGATITLVDVTKDDTPETIISKTDGTHNKAAYDTMLAKYKALYIEMARALMTGELKKDKPLTTSSSEIVEPAEPEE